MFYQDPSWLDKSTALKPVSALFSLTPSESKRLIARAVARLPQVKAALAPWLAVWPGVALSLFVLGPTF